MNVNPTLIARSSEASDSPLVTVFLACCLFVALVTAHPSATAGELSFLAGNQRLNAGVKTFVDLRDKNIRKQNLDWTCGLAALATLINWSSSEAVTEEELLAQALATFPDASERFAVQGLSLLEIKILAQARGYRASAYKVPPEMLLKLRTPVLVYLDSGTTNHFSVLRGIDPVSRRAYLADPSLGHQRLPLYRFLEMWDTQDGKGILLALDRDGITWAANSRPPAGKLQPELDALRLRMQATGPR